MVLTVAPTTWSPAAFSTGTLSPVTIDSSTADAPSSTSPSTGILAPGDTWTMSPTWTSARETSTRSPARSISAVAGRNCMSRSIAAEAWRLARASIQRPSRTKPMMIMAVS